MGEFKKFVTILAAVALLVGGCTQAEQAQAPSTVTGPDTSVNPPDGDQGRKYPPKGDEDGDGLLNGFETSLDTDPLSADTDNDGVDDGAEIAQGSDPKDPRSKERGPNVCDDLAIPAETGTSHPPCLPLSWANFDRDADGISDLEDNCLETPNPDQKNSDREIVRHLIQRGYPADTDGDGYFDDEAEAQMASQVADAMLPDELGDACDSDDDGDGITDSQELSFNYCPSKATPCRTNPLEPDTDGDGIIDGIEDNNTNGIVDSGETDPTVAN